MGGEEKREREKECGEGRERGKERERERERERWRGRGREGKQRNRREGVQEIEDTMNKLMIEIVPKMRIRSNLVSLWQIAAYHGDECKGKDVDDVHIENREKGKEVTIITTTDAVIHPRAMVIKLLSSENNKSLHHQRLSWHHTILKIIIMGPHRACKRYDKAWPKCIAMCSNRQIWFLTNLASYLPRKEPNKKRQRSDEPKKTASLAQLPLC